MTDGTVAFQHYLGESFPLFTIDKRTRDALAAYCAHRWPAGRRKAVMREWGLTEDEARSVCSGRASWATFDKIVFHKRGRWTVLFPIFGAMLDETAEHFIVSQRKAHAEQAQRLGALVGDWWPLAADPRPDRPDHADALGERRRAVGDRSARFDGQ